jgi:hypothetical protein
MAGVITACIAIGAMAAVAVALAYTAGPAVTASANTMVKVFLLSSSFSSAFSTTFGLTADISLPMSIMLSIPNFIAVLLQFVKFLFHLIAEEGNLARLYIRFILNN